jgi:acyl-CoA synthetase (AMP-forming)/AMP-acid ligase II
LTTVYAAFERTAAAHGGKAFLEFPAHRTRYTYAEAHQRIGDTAARYRTRGYGRGHRVGLQLENRPEFPLHFLALNSLGVSVVPLNPDYRAAELEYVLQHSEASALVNAQTLEDLPHPRKAGDAGECALLYTSGTTGKPKGCLLSDVYFLRWASAISTRVACARYATARSGSSRRCRSST